MVRPPYTRQTEARTLDCLIWRGIGPEEAKTRYPPESKSDSLERFVELVSPGVQPEPKIAGRVKNRP
jgi:hypothetical protein